GDAAEIAQAVLKDICPEALRRTIPRGSLYIEVIQGWNIRVRIRPVHHRSGLEFTLLGETWFPPPRSSCAHLRLCAHRGGRFPGSGLRCRASNCSPTQLLHGGN